MDPVFYNDFEPFAAEWLRHLANGRELPTGVVDGRPIQEVTADDVRTYTQAHFFAGIGGWAYALRLAGWNPNWPVWTGSCPCQPFSAAGKQKGETDPRHLWPEWFRLIRELHPPVIFGEQVASAIRFGWLDLVLRDLEGEGYTCGAVVLGAHSVGAPHIRQRLYFVGDTFGARPQGWRVCRDSADERFTGPAGVAGGSVDHSHGARPIPAREGSASAAWDESRVCGPERGCAEGGMADADGRQSGDGELQRGREHGLEQADGGAGRLADTERGSAERRGHDVAGAPEGAEGETRKRERLWYDAWAGCEFIPCTDGKTRPIEPGSFPLAHGISARVGRLRAYGNAIVPQVAATFIRSYLEERMI